MNRSIFAAFRIGSVALALVAVAPAATVTYTVTDLGTDHVINGFQTRIINDKGEIIASDLGANGHAFLYSGGQWNDLGHLNGSGMGNHGTIARGLNNGGLVVGQSDTGAMEQVDAVFKDGNGTLTALGLVDGMNTNKDAVAYACNDRGTILGNVIDYGAGTRETFIRQSGTVASITDNIYSFGLNRFGDVLGQTVGLVSETRLNGAPLPTITTGFIPHAINNVGQVLLSADTTHPINGAWGLIYDSVSGKTKVLGNLSTKSAGYTSYFDINDAGIVVGRGSDENLEPHAVVSTPKGFLSLDSLGLTVGGQAVHLTEAHGINNAGQIVCVGYTTDPQVQHGFLLTPGALTTLPLAAVYDGLASVGGTNVGAVSISVTKTGSFSVKLKTPGVSYAFAGKLTNDAFTGPVTVKGVTLTVNLQADAAHEQIAGTIADSTSIFDVAAVRQVKRGLFKGSLTALLQIPGVPNPVNPQGTGFGTITVSKTGGIKVTGQLGDATKYSVSGALHIDGTWTFYAPLYTKTPQPGGIAGLVTFDRSAAETDCLGTLKWIGPTFSTDVTLKGAYFKAVKNAQHLRFTNTTAGVATLTLTGGEQAVPAHTLSVSNKNIVTVTDAAADNLSVKLSTRGALTGSFIHDVTGKKTTFAGVLQQKLNVGGGVFKGQTTAGAVSLVPAP